MRKRVAVGLCGALTAALCVLPGQAGAVLPGEPGQIAFTRNNDHNIGEVYVIEPDGTGETNLTNNAANDHSPAWSPDGTRLLFTSDRDPGDVNDGDLYTMDPDGSNLVRVTVGARAGMGEWSPDGSRIVFFGCPSGVSCETYSVDATGGSFTPLCDPVCSFAFPSWSPYGEPIAFAGINTVNSDGTGSSDLGSGEHGAPDWSPDFTRLAAMRAICTTRCSGGKLEMVHWPSGTTEPVPGSELVDFDPAFSPDGNSLVFTHDGGNFDYSLIIMGTDGSGRNTLTPGPDDMQPDWQTLNPSPVPVGYARPKSATPLSVPLVPAYRACAPSAANRVHGPPLAHPSCAPPVRVSTLAWLTVGTPDSNGQGANFIGSARMTTMVGNPATPADEADVRIQVSMSDIRCTSVVVEDPETEGFPCKEAPLSDYTGEVQLVTAMQITDRLSTGGRTGTTVEIPAAATIPCTATPSAATGGDCSLTTSFDSLMPGAVVENKRAIWAFDPIQVFETGVDGDAETEGDRQLFATQGVFVP